MSKYKSSVQIGLVLAVLISPACSSVSKVKRFDQCCSPFDKPTEFVIYDYSYDDVYKVHSQDDWLKTTPVSELYAQAIGRADEFAAQRGKTIAVLGSRRYQGRFDLVHNPKSKAEIVFVLVDEESFVPTRRKIGDNPEFPKIE
jgi:hypothetical protein